MHAVRKIEELTRTDRVARRGCRAAAPDAAGLSAHNASAGKRAMPEAGGRSCYSAVPSSRNDAAGGTDRPVCGMTRGRPAAGSSGNSCCSATMKLTIERAAFLKALGHVQSVVERRTTIPILSNVLLRAEAGKLALTATDMDLEIVERGAGADRARGRAPPRRPTRSTTSSASCARARRSRSRRAASARPMVLRSGRSTFTLACLPPEDYPLMAGGELPHNFTLSATELRSADRPHPIRDLDRGDALLPERHLSPRDQEPTKCRCCAPWRPTATGWRAMEMVAARGRRRHAGRHRAAQDRARTAQAGRGERGRGRRSRSATPRSASPSARRR